MRFLSLIAVVVFVSSLAAPARAGMADDCVQEYDWDLQIGGCTAMIGSGQYSGKDLGTAYYNRGNAYANLGEYRRAIEDYDQALRLDPGDALAYNNRGNSYAIVGEYRRAIEGYDQALRINQRDTSAYYNRGLAYYDLGEYRRAIEDYDAMPPTTAGSPYATSANRRMSLRAAEPGGTGGLSEGLVPVAGVSGGGLDLAGPGNFRFGSNYDLRHRLAPRLECGDKQTFSAERRQCGGRQP